MSVPSVEMPGDIMGKMEAILQIVLIVFLAYEAIIDLKYKQIETVPVLIVGIVGIVSEMFMGKNFIYILSAVMPGMILLAVGKLTDTIGCGDGLMVTCTGIIVGWMKVAVILWIAFCMAGIIGGIGRLFMKKGRKDTLPFVPYLLIGYLLSGIISL